MCVDVNCAMDRCVWMREYDQFRKGTVRTGCQRDRLYQLKWLHNVGRHVGIQNPTLYCSTATSRWSTCVHEWSLSLSLYLFQKYVNTWASSMYMYTNTGSERSPHTHTHTQKPTQTAPFYMLCAGSLVFVLKSVTCVCLFGMLFKNLFYFISFLLLYLSFSSVFAYISILQRRQSTSRFHLVCTQQRAWTNQAASIFLVRFISGCCCCVGTFLIHFYCHYRLNITFFFSSSSFLFIYFCRISFKTLT